MIKLIQPRPPRSGKKSTTIHPEWEEFFEASVYTPEACRRELRMANGTFYRQIQKPPSFVMKLAMRTLFEGLEPWGKP